MSSASGYECIDAAHDPETYIRRLDRVGSSDFWHSTKQLTYTMLELRDGSEVLDVGCGTGDDVRALAQAVAPSGRSVGVDASRAMVAEARRRSTGLDAAVEFHQSDASRLPFADDRFDACRVERVLQHLNEPRDALLEMVRVIRPGGRLVAVEPDYATLAIGGADSAVTHIVLSARRDHFRSPRIGSQLPTLFKTLGLERVVIKIRTLQSSDFESDRERLVRYADEAEGLGLVDGGQRIQWLADLATAACRGDYRQAIAVFVVAGHKP